MNDSCCEDLCAFMAVNATPTLFDEDHLSHLIKLFPYCVCIVSRGYVQKNGNIINPISFISPDVSSNLYSTLQTRSYH
jgi:hypothetical protein